MDNYLLSQSFSCYVDSEIVLYFIYLNVKQIYLFKMTVTDLNKIRILPHVPVFYAVIFPEKIYTI
jgi:hypothetical protein